MKKPLYKKMSSLALVILFSGAIGLTAGCNTSANQATPTPTGTAQPTAAQPTPVPATEPSTGKGAVNWESAIQQIATTDTEATQKQMLRKFWRNRTLRRLWSLRILNPRSWRSTPPGIISRIERMPDTC